MSLENLIVFKKSYELAMNVFHLTKSFPKEETYSMTDQIRRSSRSICTNIGEAYRKRIYPKHFVSKLTDADGECTETLIHLSFAKDCGYIPIKDFNDFKSKYEEVGKILGAIIMNPKNFIINN